MNDPKIIIVLPAFNAERTLAKTLAEIPAEYSKHILLVDDASQDDTVNLAKSTGIAVFAHIENKGSLGISGVPGRYRGRKGTILGLELPIKWIGKRSRRNPDGQSPSDGTVGYPRCACA
jgi:cellulose synthase/poly-beta-1,6-N-acetylglucosamine synthase-like glycosyltransferase